MRAGGVVALELVVNFGRRAQRLFQEGRVDERRGAVHPVKVQNRLRDVDHRCGLVQLLLYQLLAEDRLHLLRRERFTRAGVNQRRGLVLHVRPQIVPLLRNLMLFEVNLVGNVFAHIGLLSARCTCALCGREKVLEKQKNPIPASEVRWDRILNSISCGATRLGARSFASPSQYIRRKLFSRYAGL